jgi:AraC-like DNA-binding protein
VSEIAEVSRIHPFPHYTWLAYAISIQHPRLFDIHHCKHVTHCLLFTTDGQADVTWTANGAESRFLASPELTSFFPADVDEHVMAITSAGGYRGHMLCLPIGHLPLPAAAEAPAAAGFSHSAGIAAVPEFHDTALTACLHRLAMGPEGCPLAEEVGDEVVARQILLRLAELLGGTRPDWPMDQRGFTPQAMRQLVGVVDSTLACGPSAQTLGALVGLSPSHFSRKFVYSAGLSLNRFLNVRRIRKSFSLLQDERLSLSRIALDLGFSSQSHFTRLFSGLTGLTPNHFRRLQR